MVALAGVKAALVSARLYLIAGLALALATAWYFDRTAQFKAGVTQANAVCEQRAQASVITALTDHANKQTILFDFAEAEKAELAARLDRIQSSIYATRTEYRKNAQQNPLPVDCRLDAERMRSVNAARNNAQ